MSVLTLRMTLKQSARIAWQLAWQVALSRKHTHTPARSRLAYTDETTRGEVKQLDKYWQEADIILDIYLFISNFFVIIQCLISKPWSPRYCKKFIGWVTDIEYESRLL
jgi:hypothetical protein